jgi:hypothetical protein
MPRWQFGIGMLWTIGLHVRMSVVWVLIGQMQAIDATEKRRMCLIPGTCGCGLSTGSEDEIERHLGEAPAHAVR